MYRQRQESIGEGGLGGLRHLNLSRNRLGDEGAVALSQSLGQVARASLVLIDRIAAASVNRQQQTTEQVLALQCEDGPVQEDGTRQSAKRMRRDALTRYAVPSVNSELQEAERCRTNAVVPHFGLLTLQLRAVEMHGYGAHAISMAVIAPAQSLSTPISSPHLPNDSRPGGNNSSTASVPSIAVEQQSRAGIHPRACCSSITDLDLSENTLGTDGASSLLMAVRIRSLMIAAGRVEHWAAYGACDKEVGESSAEQPQSLRLQLVGCEMTDTECTDISIALASMTPRENTVEVAEATASAAGVQVADGRGDIAGVSSTAIIAAMGDVSDTQHGGGTSEDSSAGLRTGWAD